MRKGEMIMFDEVKVVDYDNLLNEVKERVNSDNKYIDFGDYLFEGCENGSYNSLSIDLIKEVMEDIKDGYTHIPEEDVDDYIEVSETLIKILEENDISCKDIVLVYVCW